MRLLFRFRFIKDVIIRQSVRGIFFKQIAVWICSHGGRLLAKKLPNWQ